MEAIIRARTTSRLCLKESRCLAWIAEELPPIGPQDVLVQTRTGAISIAVRCHYTGATHVQEVIHGIHETWATSV